MANQTIQALTGAVGGVNIPLADISTSLTEAVVLARAAGVSTPFQTVPVSSLVPPSGITEFDFILRTRADLVAIVAPVGGVFVLPAGSYFLKSSFALNANEGLQVNNVSVFLQGGGWGKVLTGGGIGIPLVQITGANGRFQALTCTLRAAAANVRVLEAGGEVSAVNQVAMEQPFASTTEPAVVQTGTGRLTLNLARINAVNRCLRNSNNQRLNVIASRVESEQGTAVEIDGANGWTLIAGGIVRTTVGGTGQAFFINAAGANLFVEECEVATATTAVCLLVSALGCASVNIEGGEWQTGNAVGTTGVSITGPITKELHVSGVTVQNIATFISHTSGTVAAANVAFCTGTTGVTTCVNWAVANIPTRGIREIGNCWNASTANMFLNHQQNDARVMRRSNASSAGNTSETGAVP